MEQTDSDQKGREGVKPGGKKGKGLVKAHV